MSLLTRKNPFTSGSHWLRDCAMYSVIVFLIMYLLQPFGLTMYQGNKLLVSLLFGAISFVCCLMFMNEQQLTETIDNVKTAITANFVRNYFVM